VSCVDLFYGFETFRCWNAQRPCLSAYCRHLKTQNGSDLRPNFTISVRIRIGHLAADTSILASHDPFILKFPPEITSCIFSLSMKILLYTCYHIVSRGLAICWECQHQLARSTRRLWSALSFTLGEPMKEEALPQLRAISDWLQLSASPPLTLWVASDSRISRDRSDPIIDTLSSIHSQHVGLKYPFVHLHPILVVSTSPPGNLRRLRIINTSNSSAGCSPTFSMTSRPSPTHLTTQNFPVLTIDFVCANLTFLTVKNGTFNGWMEVIR